MRETSANQEGLNDSPSHRQSLSDTVSFVHFSAIYLSFKNIFEEKKLNYPCSCYLKTQF